MPKAIGINIGFITNSSSCVHHFPKVLLEDPEIKRFLAAMEVDGGFIGSELWSRDTCASFLVTKEQKEEANAQLQREDYGTPPSIDLTDETVVAIYGDEYQSLASTISHMLSEACKRAGLTQGGSQEYN